jgi:hypothetical protein
MHPGGVAPTQANLKHTRRGRSDKDIPLLGLPSPQLHSRSRKQTLLKRALSGPDGLAGAQRLLSCAVAHNVSTPYPLESPFPLLAAHSTTHDYAHCIRSTPYSKEWRWKMPFNLAAPLCRVRSVKPQRLRYKLSTVYSHGPGAVNQLTRLRARPPVSRTTRIQVDVYLGPWLSKSATPPPLGPK